MEKQEAGNNRLLLTIAVLVLLFGGLILLADWQEMRAVLERAEWLPVFLALFFTAISYFCISFSFASVCRMMGIKMGRRELSEIGYVSTVMNHVVQSGGVAGFSIRFALMRPNGVSSENVVSSSIYHFFLTSLAMLAMLPIGIYYLMANASLSRPLTLALQIAMVIMIIVFGLATTLVLSDRVRKFLMQFLARPVRRITRRDIEPTLMAFDESMTQGRVSIGRQPATLALVFVLIVVDWATSAIALGFCFDALGDGVSPGVLISGFVIGIMAGVISMIPGGIGVQDASMTGIFTLLGVSFEQSILASILFRVVYYLIPYIISLGIYWRLTRRLKKGIEATI